VSSSPVSQTVEASPSATTEIGFHYPALLFVVLVAISAWVAVWCARQGYTLYYGDADAHLNIARRVLDSRTPGPEQLGTVWLPLPHLLMIPFAGRDVWWRSGVAGVIPAAGCFVIAGMFLFAAAVRAYGSAAAGFVVALLFALNPNMLYLQSIPMTESIFAAALAALLWSTLVFRDSQSAYAVAAAAVASNAASLTRYEGWFLIPFVTLFILVTAHKKWHAAVFLGVACLGPLAWFAHNQYYYSNALEFYNGPYSAKAIYAAQLSHGMAPYPGDHDWSKAVEYYFAAMKLVIGGPLLAIGAIGASIAFCKKNWWPMLLLALPPVFYVWSMHSGGTPIYVPGLWPNTWYNTRYALAALPLAAFAAGALPAFVARVLVPVASRLMGTPGVRSWTAQASSTSARLTTAIAAALLTGITAVWVGRVVKPSGEPLSICWKESEVNSTARRAWTKQTADYLTDHHREGATLIYSFGSGLPGALREAGIPLGQGLHDGNHPAWDASIARPELFLREEWALAISGDPLEQAILRTNQRAGVRGPHYELKKQIIVEGAPPIQIYQRMPYTIGPIATNPK